MVIPTFYVFLSLSITDKNIKSFLFNIGLDIYLQQIITNLCFFATLNFYFMYTFSLNIFDIWIEFEKSLL